jgi:hypothetical protein
MNRFRFDFLFTRRVIPDQGQKWSVDHRYLEQQALLLAEGSPVLINITIESIVKNMI